MPIGIHNPTHSLKPRKGRSWKRLRRIEIVALLESKFIPDNQIAAHLGLTVPAITAIKATPEFLAQRTCLQAGVMSMYQAAALTSAEAQKDELDALIPNALFAVKRILLDPTHPQYAKVALDLLDRTKATSKISRTEHSIAEPKDFHKENESAKQLLALLNDPDPQSSNPNDYATPVGLLVEENQIPQSEGPSPEPESALDPLDNLDRDSIVQ